MEGRSRADIRDRHSWAWATLAGTTMVWQRQFSLLVCLAVGLACSTPRPGAHEDPELLLRYEAGEGDGRGRHVVLISGDEEYRSEEGLPVLARMLSTLHGFRCTVLFSVDPETGIVNPTVNTNIPGTDSLDDADLMFIFTRWRVLPDEQMAPIDRYLHAGKPVIAMRTATHAFMPTTANHRKVRAYLSAVSRATDPNSVALPDIAPDEWGPYDHYGDGYTGPMEAWRDGFGRLVVGERWVAHHGEHKHESARGRIASNAARHPVLRGVSESEIWSAADVYAVRLPLPGDSMPLVYGRVMARSGEYNEDDALYGMRPDDGPAVDDKNDPMMPVAWTKTYRLPGGTQGRVFATTLGSSTDLLQAGVRKMLMNAVFWALGDEDEIPGEGAASSLVGEFNPTRFHLHSSEYWVERGARPADFR